MGPKPIKHFFFNLVFEIYLKNKFSKIPKNRKQLEIQFHL